MIWEGEGGRRGEELGGVERYGEEREGGEEGRGGGRSGEGRGETGKYGEGREWEVWGEVWCGVVSVVCVHVMC